MIEDELLIIEVVEASDYEQIFKYLNALGSLEDNPIQVSKRSSNQLVIPLCKQAVVLLSGCGYLSKEVYFKLLHITAAREASKKVQECDYNPRPDEEESSPVRGSPGHGQS